MPTIEGLADFFEAQYRWGLHPAKMFAALLAPVVIAWLADRRIRARVQAMEEEDARRRGQSRIDRR